MAKYRPPLTLKRWTEAIALRATNVRMRKIEQLLGEVAYLWGDEDQYIVNICDELAREIANARLDFVASVQARVEEREIERCRRRMIDRALRVQARRKADAVCDCQHPEETAGGFRAISVDCPIHGDR